MRCAACATAWSLNVQLRDWCVGRPTWCAHNRHRSRDVRPAGACPSLLLAAPIQSTSTDVDRGSVLGGLYTLAASYLAQMRGSDEPEFSTSRSKELKHYERELSAYLSDSGGLPVDKHDAAVLTKSGNENLGDKTEESGPQVQA